MLLKPRDEYTEMARTRTVPEEAGRQIVNYNARENIKQVGRGYRRENGIRWDERSR